MTDDPLGAHAAGFFLIRVAPLALQHLLILRGHAASANPVIPVPRMYMIEIGQCAALEWI